MILAATLAALALSAIPDLTPHPPPAPVEDAAARALAPPRSPAREARESQRSRGVLLLVGAAVAGLVGSYMIWRGDVEDREGGFNPLEPGVSHAVGYAAYGTAAVAALFGIHALATLPAAEPEPRP